MRTFTVPAMTVRLGAGPIGQHRRETYHAAAHRRQMTLNQWARHALDHAAREAIQAPPPTHAEDPPAEFCDE